MPKTQRAQYIDSKQECLSAFKRQGDKIDGEIQDIVRSGNYNQICEFNKENQNLFENYTTRGAAEGHVYDIETANIDNNTTAKLVSGLRKISLKGHAQGNFFDWKSVAKGLMNIDEAGAYDEMSSVKKTNWEIAANRYSLYSRLILIYEIFKMILFWKWSIF